ncbi:MAG: hypothetical protein WD060_11270 [Pirellulales bacterium]
MQFGFYGTGANGQQYLQADYSFADVSSLGSANLPLVTVVAGASQLASVTIATGGTGYTTPPAVTFAAPPSGGVTATGVAVIANNGVTGITITNAGYGYTTAPQVTFVSAGSGSGATATATLGTTYITTQTVTIPVPQVQNVSSALPFFVGAVNPSVLPVNGGTVATPTSSSAGGSAYGFFELNNSVGLNQQSQPVNSTLDVDVTTVDQFGIPFSVKFLKADGTTLITTMYPYNQGVGTLPGLDRASIFEAFKAEHQTDAWAAAWAQGAYSPQGTIDPSGTQVRLVPTRSLLTDPLYEGQLGGLATWYDTTLDAFFDYYKTNDFVYWQSSQGGSQTVPAPNNGTVWSGRTVTVSGGPYTGAAVDPSNTFAIEALQLTGQTGLTGITVTNNGGGLFGSTPTVVIEAPDQPGGVQATATAIMAGVVNPQTGTGLSIAGIRIDNPGSGYTTPPTVSFQGGGGTGAATALATAVINEFPGCVVNIYNPRSIQANANSLPAWMTTGTSAVKHPNWNDFSPSAMVAAAAQAFASNTVDPGVNNPTPSTPNHTAGATQLGKALGNIENVIVSAFSRGIATMPSQTAFSTDPATRALLSPQQFLAGTSNTSISWKADPVGENLSGGTLTPSTTYYYALTTVDPAGNETVPTRTVQVTLNSQQNAARLEWNPTVLPFVDQFRIYRGTLPQDLKLVGQVANNPFGTPASSFVDGKPTNPLPVNAGAPLPYQFYAAGQTYDEVSKFLHEQFINGLGYGFAFDDQGNFSTNVEFPPNQAPPITRIVINDWGKAERFDVTGPATSVAGTSFQVTVTAEQGDVLSLSSSDPQAELPSGGAFNSAAATYPIILKTAGVQTVTVSDATGRQAILSVTVSPGQAAQLGFVGQPSFAYATRFFKTPVSVQVQDAYGNAVKHGGDQVSLAFVSANGAKLLGQKTANTDANGLATFWAAAAKDRLGVSKPGNYALKATYTGTSLLLTPATSQTFSISQRTKIRVRAVPPATVQAGVPFVIVVRGSDVYFQDTVTLRVKVPGNAQIVDADGVLRPLNGYRYTFTPADKGVKRFTVSIGNPLTTRTLTALSLTAPDLSGSTTVSVVRRKSVR